MFFFFSGLFFRKQVGRVFIVESEKELYAFGFVWKGLGAIANVDGFVQVFAFGLMLDEDCPFPEKVYIACALIETVNGLFKTADLAAGDPEYIEKLVPEGFCFSPFACFVFPFL